jgi:hypothetical protein
VSLTSDGFLGTSNLLVADPTLPAFGTSIDITTSGADASDDVITGASVTAYGSGFQTGSSVIVGRNGVPGFVLPSSVSASSLATATLTSALPGDDTSLVIGVAGPGLTAVSNSVPLYSASQEHLDAQEFSDSDLANEYSSTDVDLLRLVGNINLVPAEQTGPSAQNVKVYGVNIASGTVLEVKTQSGNLTITETVPLQNITTLGTGQPAPIASLLSHTNAVWPGYEHEGPRLCDRRGAQHHSVAQSIWRDVHDVGPEGGRFHALRPCSPGRKTNSFLQPIRRQFSQHGFTVAIFSVRGVQSSAQKRIIR